MWTFVNGHMNRELNNDSVDAKLYEADNNWLMTTNGTIITHNLTRDKRTQLWPPRLKSKTQMSSGNEYVFAKRVTTRLDRMHNHSIRSAIPSEEIATHNYTDSTNSVLHASSFSKSHVDNKTWASRRLKNNRNSWTQKDRRRQHITQGTTQRVWSQVCRVTDTAWLQAALKSFVYHLKNSNTKLY